MAGIHIVRDYPVGPPRSGARSMTRLHRPGGYSMAKLPGLIRKKMLTDGLPAVLDDLDDTGALRTTAARPASPRTDGPDRRRADPAAGRVTQPQPHTLTPLLLDGVPATLRKHPSYESARPMSPAPNCRTPRVQAG